MPLNMRGNQQMRKYHWETCPHACSRASAPLANRLKYSDLRKGFCASSSVLTASNQSVVIAAPPSAQDFATLDAFRCGWTSSAWYTQALSRKRLQRLGLWRSVGAAETVRDRRVNPDKRPQR